MSDSADAVTTRAHARVGRTLREKWRLDRLLGIGGMAAVYAGTHRNGSRGAIKMLHVELSVEPEIRARFLREGYVANAVGHPGVVRVIDDDVAEDGAVFLVMELLAGETLDARWERKGQRLSPHEVLPVIDCLLDVLATAHEKGIIHRDIKPENVLITEEGEIKLLDFGIARLRDGPGATATQSGAALGTPAFMSPEQAIGSSTDVGPKTDVWAIGASMFLLMGGVSVHEAKTPNAQLIKSATTPARSLAEVCPSLPRAVIELVDRALAFDQHDRPTARELQEQARAVYRDLTGASMRDAAKLSVPAPRESAAIDLRPAARGTTGGAGASARAIGVSVPPPARRRALAWTFGAVMAFAGVVGVVALVRTRPAREAAAPAASAEPPPPPSAPPSAEAIGAPAPAATISAPPVDRPTTRLSIVARGGQCEVSVDDVAVGKTPLDDLRVTAGEHRVTCRMPTGGAVQRKVVAVLGRPAMVAFAMAAVDPLDKRK